VSALPERPSRPINDDGSDAAVVARLLGRPAAGTFVVAVRRLDGQPAVIENEPLLNDGTPMPTLFWLVDPELTAAISRLEAAGGVRMAADVLSGPEVARAHDRYAALRDAKLTLGHVGPVPSGGVGGTRRGVKCLHAHVAWHLAGGDDPVGRWTWEQLAISDSQFRTTHHG
jgi:uncharacterized protein